VKSSSHRRADAIDAILRANGLEHAATGRQNRKKTEPNNIERDAENMALPSAMLTEAS
jgi:hypothetical protein